MINAETEWEKDRREYGAMSPEEKTWHKVSSPARKIYYVDVGEMNPKQAMAYLTHLKEEIKNDSKESSNI